MTPPVYIMVIAFSSISSWFVYTLLSLVVILSELCVVIISSGGGKWLASAVKQILFWIRACQSNLEALYFLISNLQCVLPWHPLSYSVE